MTTLKFRGSSFSLPSMHLSTPTDGRVIKYRGHECPAHQAIAKTSVTKGLKYRGISY
ncbi:hypothetical protein Lepto7376_1589 [[Leptolyngbya] sp. PCC 7376]|uniref:DUF4278 domain-containing protein n=1 Tax=[Leptolyngbya] sp. PCC 7376 TaxID=111781 RepID=UPI00029F1338|nr:DUF4278 domain-containing protein [[Leptolyngbya] sp. PCC 7376]AFY37926.1 hypothetical protein Lepto7376_1589 [[Leptolyngbya] sp. PCC 7376]